MTLAEELEQLGQDFRKKNVGIYPVRGSRFVEIIKSNFDLNLDKLLAEVCRKSLEAAAAKDCLLCKQCVPMDGNKLHRHTLTGLTERCRASHIRSIFPSRPQSREDHK